MMNFLLKDNTSDRIAVITETGQEITYSELKSDVKNAAHLLKDRELIFIICQNDYVPLQFYLAALEVGSVPLFLSSDVQAAQLQKLFKTYSPHLVLAATPLNEILGGLQPLSQHDGYTLYKNDGSSCPKLHKDLAFLAATSGSTGDQKLVRLSANNLKSNALSIIKYLDITPNDRAIAHLPMYYSYGLSVINSHLMAGASIVLSNHSILQKEFWQQINTHHVTSFSGVPFHFEMLLRLGLKRLKMPSVNKITQAGGKLDVEKIEKLHAYCEAKNIQLWIMYGQTEASPRMSYLAPNDISERRASIGKAIPDGKIWICDDQGEIVTAPNQIGELIFEGPNVFMGYATSSEELALEDQQHGLLKTGDLAYIDADGFYYIEGRISRFLKIYGNRIALDQVEQMIHSDELQGVASGQDDSLIVHIVNLKNEEQAISLQEKLAKSMKINPKAITVKAIDEIPRLASGKIDYQCLR